MNYQGKKTFTVEHEPTYGEITVEIDFDWKGNFGKGEVNIMELIEEQVNFWSGSEDLIEENDGDIVKTYLKNLCAEVLRVDMEYQTGESIIKREFEQREGWITIDGKYGVKLLSVESMEVSNHSDFTITVKE